MDYKAIVLNSSPDLFTNVSTISLGKLLSTKSASGSLLSKANLGSISNMIFFDSTTLYGSSFPTNLKFKKTPCALKTILKMSYKCTPIKSLTSIPFSSFSIKESKIMSSVFTRISASSRSRQSSTMLFTAIMKSLRRTAASSKYFISGKSSIAP